MVMDARQGSFEEVLGGLSAAGEATRLRLLAILCDAELTVSELVAILGQSQPRISRHLKLLVEARPRRAAPRRRLGVPARRAVGSHAVLARRIVSAVSPDDPTFVADRARLGEVRAARADQAARYFASHAATWDRMRAMHIAEDRVEGAVRAAVGAAPLDAVLDIGTGTGRMLELLAPQANRALGIDQSPPMLSVARDRLDRAGLRNVQLRQGDMFALPVERNAFDLVVLHQVLHYLDDPARALREAARTLRPGGRLLVVDFAPHAEESLRDDHAHRRLGFSPDEIAGFMADAGPRRDAGARSRAGPADGGKLTVSLWMARDRRVIADVQPLHLREIA